MLLLVCAQYFCMYIFTLLVSFFVIIYTFYKWNYTYWKSKGLPYLEPKIPFGSHISSKNKEKLCPGLRLKTWYDKFKELGHRHGGIYMFATPMYFPVDPEIIKTIISKDFKYFTDRGIMYNEKKDPISAHLISMEGKRWKNLRSKLTPTFSSGQLKMMFSTLVECSKNLEESVSNLCEDGEAIDIKEIFCCYTTDVIGSCAFGLDCQSFKDKDSPFRKYGKLIFTISKTQSIKRMLTFAFPQLAKLLGLRMVRKEISEFFVKVVRDTVQYRETYHVYRKDFMQLLINIRNGANPDKLNEEVVNSSNKLLTIEQMAAQAFAFFSAGFETSSTTMSFCLYELAIAQDIQDRVRKEIKEVLKKHDDNFTYEAVQDMKYLEQVLDETLRKYPAIPSLNRQCTEDYRIPDTDVVLEKGIKVLISIMGLHHDPEYFPEPEKFIPERFGDENKQSIQPYTYLPFGDGPRNCIGLRFGMTQSKVGLAVLLRKYRFTLNSKTRTPLQMEPRNFILTPLGGMWLNVEKI